MIELQNEKQNKVINNNHWLRSWISESTWQLIDGKAEAQRIGNIVETAWLKKVIRKALRKDRKQVEKHLFVESTPMTNIMESLNIDVFMERIIWWKPFPIPNNTT